MSRLAQLTLLASLAGACGASPPRVASLSTGRDARSRFNTTAVRLDLPVFWATDSNGDGAPDPDEIRSLLFYPTSDQAEWVRDGAFTPAFADAAARIAAEQAAAPFPDPRREALRRELDASSPVLVETDLSNMQGTHRDFARRMLHVAALVDQLYARQLGSDRAEALLDPADALARSIVRRNWGAWCLSPRSEPTCSALGDGVAWRAIRDVYPAPAQAHSGFCQQYDASPDAARLTAPYSVVREDEAGLHAVPYFEAYAELMSGIAQDLSDAAEAMSDSSETGLVQYLRTMAIAFGPDGSPTDRDAWIAMGAAPSQWYLSIGAERTAWDPCHHKRAFAMTLGRSDRSARPWQARLLPLLGDMERAIASLGRGSYLARDVSDHRMSDIVDVVFTAGMDRLPTGAWTGLTRGGRSVVFSNYDESEDARASLRGAAASVLDAVTLAALPSDDAATVLATVIHEVAHSLGPHPSGRGALPGASRAAFPGEIEDVLAELQAETATLYFADWLRACGLIDAAMARAIYVDTIRGGLAPLGLGMYRNGQRAADPQAAALMFGLLAEEGGLRWEPRAATADGAHEGAFTVDADRMHDAAAAVLGRVVHMIATVDRPTFDAIAARYVDGDGLPRATVRERLGSRPGTSYVYSVRW